MPNLYQTSQLSDVIKIVQGYGHNLLDLALQEIDEQTTVYLFTELNNIAAHQFYESRGFRRLDCSESFYSHDGVLMYVRMK